MRIRGAVTLVAVGLLTPATPATPATAAPCSPSQLPASRQGGDLTVSSPPLPMRKPGGSRLRTHVEGSLGAPPAGRNHPSYKGRQWAGPEVPAFVPLTIGTLELFILDPDPEADRYLALYRDPYGSGTCALGDRTNCAFEARVYDCSGKLLASLPLAKYFSAKDGLELQDVRLANDTLYFNEACQSYSKENAGKCSALVAVDIKSKRLLWRTKHLVSNNVFLVTPKYLVTGYGFTSEPSALFLVRRSDGTVVVKQPLKEVIWPGGNHDALELLPGNLLKVGLYEHPEDAVLQLEGLDGAKPRFHVVKEPKVIRTQPHTP